VTIFNFWFGQPRENKFVSNLFAYLSLTYVCSQTSQKFEIGLNPSPVWNSLYPKVFSVMLVAASSSAEYVMCLCLFCIIDSLNDYFLSLNT